MALPAKLQNQLESALECQIREMSMMLPLRAKRIARMLHTFLQTSYAIDSGHSTQHLLQLSRSFFQMSVLVFPGLY
jgi:hypothetical protein